MRWAVVTGALLVVCLSLPSRGLAQPTDLRAQALAAGLSEGDAAAVAQLLEVTEHDARVDGPMIATGVALLITGYAAGIVTTLFFTSCSHCDGTPQMLGLAPFVSGLPFNLMFGVPCAAMQLTGLILLIVGAISRPSDDPPEAGAVSLQVRPDGTGLSLLF